MENNSNSKTVEFISLIKCILEYYATTTNIKNEDDSKEEDIGELLGQLKAFETGALASIDLPKNIDKEIEEAFISHIKFFKNSLDSK